MFCIMWAVAFGDSTSVQIQQQSRGHMLSSSCGICVTRVLNFRKAKATLGALYVSQTSLAAWVCECVCLLLDVLHSL